MLILLDLNKIKVEGLIHYKDLKRERDVKKGTDILSFSYPKKFATHIKEEHYIRTKYNEYVIKAIDKSDPVWISIQAKVNVEDLSLRLLIGLK